MVMHTQTNLGLMNSVYLEQIQLVDVLVSGRLGQRCQGVRIILILFVLMVLVGYQQMFCKHMPVVLLSKEYYKSEEEDMDQTRFLCLMLGVLVIGRKQFLFMKRIVHVVAAYHLIALVDQNPVYLMVSRNIDRVPVHTLRQMIVMLVPRELVIIPHPTFVLCVGDKKDIHNYIDRINRLCYYFGKQVIFYLKFNI